MGIYRDGWLINCQTIRRSIMNIQNIVWGNMYASSWNVKGIKRGCQYVLGIRGTQGCAFVRNVAQAKGDCRDVAMAQPWVNVSSLGQYAGRHYENPL